MKKQYKIEKTINNNISFSVDEQGNEIVILGRGIAFGKKRGDMIDGALVEKTFELKDSRQKNMFAEMIEGIPEVYLDITHQIVELYEKQFNRQLNPMIYVGLSDHIYNAVQNCLIGITTPNDMLNQIKRIYPQEFSVAKKALDVIKDKLGVSLSEEEAGYIVLHYVNALAKYPRDDAAKRTAFINEIVRITEEYFKLSLDENSVNYARFVTHLDFLFSRIFTKNKENSATSPFMYMLAKGKFPDVEAAVEKIENFICNTYQKQITDEEKGYLIVHICNLLRIKDI